MEFDEKLTAILFSAVIALGVIAMLGSGMMAQRTVLMMVAPSMAVYGLVMLIIGVKHGKYRANK